MPSRQGGLRAATPQFLDVGARWLNDRIVLIAVGVRDARLMTRTDGEGLADGIYDTDALFFFVMPPLM